MLADAPSPRGSDADLSIVGTLSERFRQVVAFPPELLEYSSWETRSGRDLFFAGQSLQQLFRSQPLGQPEKAIGHEPQIEPWLTPHNRSARKFQNRVASSRPEHETAEREQR